MTRDEAFVLGRLDGHGQSALMRRGEVTSSELVEAAIVRIEALDPQIKAVSAKDFERARTRATAPQPDGPLAGVPYLLKDSLSYPGMVGRGGSASTSSQPATKAWPYTERLDEAGLIPLGKSAMPEFGLLGVTEPLIGPITRNPWQAGRSPGGSSGGAAAAVASGMLPLAHGSDGAGSIRIPASACGLVGLKPGRGTTVRVRSRHVIEDLLVGDGLMSRSVRDVEAGFALGHPARPSVVERASSRRLRIAVSTRALSGEVCAPELAAVTQRAADLCADLGHHVEWAEPDIDGPAADAAERTLWSHIGADCVDAARASGRDPEAVLEPWTLWLGRHAHSLTTDQLEAAYGQLAALPRQLEGFFRTFDVFLTPTLSHLPPMIGEMAPTVDGELLMQRMFGWLGFTPLQNLAGTPAISLPLFEAETLPAGSMFAADRGCEDLLLGLAFELEQAAPWADRWPGLSVGQS
ncbi:amidase family protein [Brevundimonas sp.]|uniref:amidase family protein n=1 Tax=Brevundimonas sp. TaxID=1871086 RepID=UPI003BA94931